MKRSIFKKLLLILFFGLLCNLSYSQYTGSPNNKITLGNQTSGDGLYYRTDANPNWTPSSRLNAWMALDTTKGIFWHRQGNQWLSNFTHPGNIWTARSAAEANQWVSVTYGNGLFVAVANTGTNRVMTSSDGTTWTARSASEANSWQSVTYGNGLFVAVANTGTNQVMTSPDGITWTARSAAEANSWRSVTYGNGLFVAVANSGTNRVMTSPDGITWTARSAAEANSWLSVTYGNGLFVAVSSDGTNRVMTSPDGITWTARSATDPNGWGSVTYGNGLFVAVAFSGLTNVRIMTSPDGINWTARSAIANIIWRSVTYGNGLFVAVAGTGTDRVMASPDGITWTARSASEANSWQSVTYGNGLFVAVSSDGTNRVMTSGFPIERNLTTASGTGTVTSIATNNGITGGPIVDSGTIGLTGQALALHNLSTNGIISRTGAGTVAARIITAGTGISITNGDGVSANPTITNTAPDQMVSIASGTGISTSGTYPNFNITNSAPEATTARNVNATGEGEGIYRDEVGNELQFKKLVAGSNITLTAADSSITIASTGGGGDFGTVAANKVAFGAASGDTLTSNTNLHWDNTNGRLGIGTSSPAVALEVSGAGYTGELTVKTSTNAPSISMGSFLAPNTPLTNQADVYLAVGKELSIPEAVLLGFSRTGAPSAPYGFLTMYGRPASDFVVSSTGRIGFGTVTPSFNLSIGGNSARTIGTERHTAADNAGNSLTLKVGGAASGATDAAGGDLVLESGVSTGTGTSNIIFRTPTSGLTGNTDNVLSDKVIINSQGRVGIGESTNLSGAINLAPASGEKINLFSSGTAGLRIGFSVQNNELRTYGNSSTFFTWYNQGNNGNERMRLTNGGWLGLGTTDPISVIEARFNSTTTSSPVTIFTSSVNTTGTPAIGFGNRFLFRAERVGVTDAEQGAIVTRWANVTSGTQRSDMGLWVVGKSGNIEEIVTIENDGDVGINTSVPKTSLHIDGAISRSVPVTVTGNYTVAKTTSWIICDNNAGTTQLSLPTPGDFVGRELMIKTIENQSVVSSSFNVVPLAGGSAGTAILSATAGKWATLVSDGTNWIIMQAN